MSQQEDDVHALLEMLSHSHFLFFKVQSMRRAPCIEVTPGLVFVCFYASNHFVSSAFPGDGKADSSHGPRLHQVEDSLLTGVFNAYVNTHRRLSELS